MRKVYPGLGINVLIKHSTRESIDSYIDRLIELGMEWVRLEFDFAAKSEPVMTGYFIAKCKKNNIKILGLISSAVPGTLKNLFFPQISNIAVYSRQAELNRYVVDLIRRYGKFINHWEVLNEANLKRFWVRNPNANEYVEVLKSVATTIRSHQPTANILFAGIVGYDDRFDGMPFKKVGFFTQAMQAGAADYFDIANFHLYGWDSYFSWRNKAHYISWLTNMLESCIAVAKLHTNKPIWITEFGLGPRWLKLSAEDIAEIYLHLYRKCQTYKIPLFLWTLNDWEDIDRVYEKYTPENCFGLLDQNLTPKPTYDSLLKFLAKIE